jgi:hypothetical protein
MLTAATTEVVRLASRVVRRIDAGLVQSAVRNAETSVLAGHHRWLDEMQTLSDLYALPGLPADPDDAQVAAVARPRRAPDDERGPHDEHLQHALAAAAR